MKLQKNFFFITYPKSKETIQGDMGLKKFMRNFEKYFLTFYVVISRTFFIKIQRNGAKFSPNCSSSLPKNISYPQHPGPPGPPPPQPGVSRHVGLFVKCHQFSKRLPLFATQRYRIRERKRVNLLKTIAKQEGHKKKRLRLNTRGGGYGRNGTAIKKIPFQQLPLIHNT